MISELNCLLFIVSAIAAGPEHGPKEVAKLPKNEIIVTATLDVPIERKRTMVYCASLQDAWKSLSKELSADSIQMDEASPLALQLNKGIALPTPTVPRAALMVRIMSSQKSVGQTSRELAARFGENAPRLEKMPGDHEAVLYTHAYLRPTFSEPFFTYKHTVFAQWPELYFVQSLTVPSVNEHARKRERIMPLIHIFEYDPPNLKVVAIQTAQPGEMLVLAQVPAVKTLQEAVDFVQAKIKNPPRNYNTEFEELDNLTFPKIHLQTRQEYVELCDRLLQASKDGFDRLAYAIQDIDFQLDSEGLLWRYRPSRIAVKGGRSRSRPYRRPISFDQPFVIFLTCDGAAPYFVAWIGDFTTLVPGKRLVVKG
ncbi:hypothetical protein RAS2_03790 [Phycisphaerae bacterium RAS2]|nr:hypothetical protein RAS2_03790 [Phycisphaerae bacterium RAS2]